MREQLNIQYSDFRSQIMTIEELLYHIQKKVYTMPFPSIVVPQGHSSPD